MIVKKEWIVFKDADSTANSEVYGTNGAEKLFIQVDGTFTTIAVEVKGKLHEDAEEVTDATSIAAKGIFEIDLKPYKYFTINIKTFSGTSATIYARTIA